MENYSISSFKLFKIYNKLPNERDEKHTGKEQLALVLDILKQSN